MKICLDLEFYNICSGGILSSFKNQQTILKSLGIPFVRTYDKSCDILQVNLVGPRAILLMKKAHKQGKKVVVWAHSTVEDTEQLFQIVPFITPLFRSHLTYAYGLADVIFAPSEFTKRSLISYGLPKEKIVVMSNAVDVEKFQPNQSKRLIGRKNNGLDGVTVGTMGLVMPRKGVSDFLHISQDFKENPFIWYGKIFKSYSSPFIEPLPSRLPSNVQFTGFVEDANEAYNTLDIFLFPSYAENEGMAILEACAVGLPVIVRDIPAYEGWLIQGVNCFKAKNNREFSTYVRQLLDDPALREKLGKQAKILANQKSTKIAAERTVAEYEKLLAA